jgi:TRAP transporter TAXI family solute receptor
MMDFLQKMEEHIVLIATVVLLSLLALAAYIIISSLPPREFTILTGRAGGGYYQAAQAYQKIAAERGFTLNIRETSGSVETLRLLQEGEAEIGFVQGGIAVGADPQQLSTLSSVFYEPVWIFVRKDSGIQEQLQDLDSLAGLRVAIGEPNSGTNKLARQILGVTGLTEENATFLELNSPDSAAALRDGTVDAAMFVVAPTSQTIQDLLRDDDLMLFNVARAEAYRSYFPFLTHVTLPQGSIDLVKNIPPQDTKLIASVANIIVRNDFHPDLIRLMTIAIVQTHEQGGLFEQRFEFPNFQYTDLPIGKEELAYVERIKSGESTLDNYLPFWAAALIDRYLLFVVPIAFLFLPLLSRSSYLYTFYSRRKITRWYQIVREIDVRLPTMTLEQVDSAMTTVQHIEDQLRERVKVTELWMPDLYGLLEHIDLFQMRLEKRRDQLLAEAAASEAAAGDAAPQAT